MSKDFRGAKKGAEPPPIFGLCLLRPNGCMDQDATWYGGTSRPRRYKRLLGTQIPTPKRGQSPQFSAHFYCGQTAGCIKMPLGMVVGLGPGHIVLDCLPAPSAKRGGTLPIFGPRLLWPNGCIDQDAIWYGGRPRLTRHCVRLRPSSPPLNGHRPPIFGKCPLWPNGWMD